MAKRIGVTDEAVEQGNGEVSKRHRGPLNQFKVMAAIERIVGRLPESEQKGVVAWVLNRFKHLDSVAK